MKQIGGLFGKSPFGPLLEHIIRVHECVCLLKDLTSICRKDSRTRKNWAHQISKAEHSADIIKKELKVRLTKSLFASVQRSDILFLLKQQDDIADAAEDVARLMSIRKTEVPEALFPYIDTVIDKLCAKTDLLCQAMTGLTSTETTDENNDLMKSIYLLIDQADTLEELFDTSLDDFLKHLFSMEKEIDTLSIYFLHRVSHHLNQLAEHAQNTCDGLRRILVRL